MKVARMDAEELAWAKANLKHDVCFLMDEYNIPSSRVANLDETASCVVPVTNRSWARKGATNVCFCHRLSSTNHDGSMMAQMIWKGKTTAVLPAATPENKLSSYCESHWSTAETLHDVLDFTVRKLAGGPESPCIFILDCAPTHISTSFIEMWKEKLPWIHLANVAPNHTPFSQPLDVAYNRPLKEAIRTRYMKYMAREVLAQDLVGTTPTSRHCGSP